MNIHRPNRRSSNARRKLSSPTPTTLAPIPVSRSGDRASFRRFGFVNPVLIDGDNRIIAGHGRVMAARELGLEQVPVIRLEPMSEAEKKAYIIADNRIADEGGWDREVLALELQCLIDLDFAVEATGFESRRSISSSAIMTRRREGADPDDTIPAPVEGTGDYPPRRSLAPRRRTGSCAATRGRRAPIARSSERRRRGWSSPTRPTTSPSRGMSAASERRSIASSPWPPARCRRRNSPPSSHGPDGG